MGSPLFEISPKDIFFPHTYISSIARYTIQIDNNTDDHGHFQWRRYGSHKEEESIKAKKDVSNVEGRNEYCDSVEYHSSIFQFSHPSGVIWPHQTTEIVITFIPELALTYDETIYFYVEEIDKYFPLHLKGSGLAPDARFNIDTINIGQIPLDTIQEYEVILENVGQVGVNFQLQRRNKSSQGFEFSPESGFIPIGQSIKVHCTFTANVVGTFNDIFDFHIKGATKFHPTLTLYGRVMGPTYIVSTKSLQFNAISLVFFISNTSKLKTNLTLLLITEYIYKTMAIFQNENFSLDHQLERYNLLESSKLK